MTETWNDQVELSQAGLLDLYRSYISTELMPSAYGQLDYSVRSVTEVEERSFEDLHRPVLSHLHRTGVYRLRSMNPEVPEPAWVNLYVDQYQVLTNLDTCQSVLRVYRDHEGFLYPDTKPFVPWHPRPGARLTIDARELERELLMYL